MNNPRPITNSVRSFAALIILFLISAFLICITFFYSTLDSDTAELFIEPGNSSLYLKDYDLTIKGWDDSGKTLFFIPA
ncbi:MAG: hypothetical protein K6F86_10035, partial [Lachnospiraceae bacterium]|nr:hypothetical protein [Lachnospiraceae bacterium]